MRTWISERDARALEMREAVPRGESHRQNSAILAEMASRADLGSGRCVATSLPPRKGCSRPIFDRIFAFAHMTDKAIFLDYHAHGPLDPAVARALTHAFDAFDANPHSGSIASEAARGAVEAARASVGRLLGVPASEIVFTSGATEANNLAFAGLADHLHSIGRRRLVVSAIEHASVLESALHQGDRFDVRLAPVLSNGLVDLARLEGLVTPDTGMVSIAAANHEIGVIQPLSDIVAIARRAGALVHTDLAQAAGKITSDLTNVDLASVSAHKIHGPFGVGALYVRRSVQKHLKPVLHGGGQERGLRSGTVPVPLCIAFGVAADLAKERQAEDGKRVEGLRTRLLAGLERSGRVEINGDLGRRLPGNLNLRFAGVDAEALVMRLRHQVVISTGSACTTDSLDPSPVLLALGLDRSMAETAVRIGLGRFTTEAEIDQAITIIGAAVADLRAVSQRAVA